MEEQKDGIVLFSPQPGKPLKGTLGLLLFDESGSMQRFGDTPRRSLNLYVKNLKASPNAAAISVGVLAFADKTRILEPVKSVKSITEVARYEPEGNTMLYGATRLALSSLITLKHRGGFAGNADVMIFTDGEDTVCDRTHPVDLIEVRQLAALIRGEEWIRVYVTGFGVDARKILRDMGFPDAGPYGISVDATEDAIAKTMRHASHITNLTSLGVRPSVGSDSGPPSSPTG